MLFVGVLLVRRATRAQQLCSMLWAHLLWARQTATGITTACRHQKRGDSHIARTCWLQADALPRDANPTPAPAPPFPPLRDGRLQVQLSLGGLDGQDLITLAGDGVADEAEGVVGLELLRTAFSLRAP
jgi:hypothetical protein